MKKTFITTSIIAALMAMPAFAGPTAQELLDQKTVTSKYYVDQELATKQDKMTCAGYVSGHENDDDYCWLYSLEEPQAPAPSCLAGGEPCGGDDSLCCSGHCSGKGWTCGD